MKTPDLISKCHCMGQNSYSIVPCFLPSTTLIFGYCFQAELPKKCLDPRDICKPCRAPLPHSIIFLTHIEMHIFADFRGIYIPSKSSLSDPI